MTAAFEFLAIAIVAANDNNLLEYGPEEQVAHAVKALEHFAKTTPLTPVDDTVIDLAGFGEAAVHFASSDSRYLLLSEVAGQLGMPVWKACDWAELQHRFAVQDQRRADEERGDGRLGYEHLRDYVDLRFMFTAEDPEAKPDAGGRRCSSYGDWLICNDRLPLFLACSPWGKEFVDNVFDHFSISMRKVWGDKLNELTAYHADGTPAPGVKLFHTDLSEEEALRKACRGPVGGLGGAS